MVRVWFDAINWGGTRFQPSPPRLFLLVASPFNMTPHAVYTSPLCRPCRPRAISENYSVWADVGSAIVCDSHGWGQRWGYWHVKRASSNCSSFKCSRCCLHYQGRKVAPRTSSWLNFTQIDMTPPNVLAETTNQVVKILKSPGCR